jgi:hypothetical protein
MRSTFDAPGRGDSRRRDRSSVGGAIAELVRAAEDGRARGPAGETYTRAQLRDLRSALSHLDAELGSLPLQSLRHRHVDALLQDLREEGLSARRENALLVALDLLYAHRAESRKERPAETRTPTDAMLALGARVAWWASATVFVLFACVLVVLAVALA